MRHFFRVGWKCFGVFWLGDGVAMTAILGSRTYVGEASGMVPRSVGGDLMHLMHRNGDLVLGRPRLLRMFARVGRRVESGPGGDVQNMPHGPGGDCECRSRPWERS
jgi:hypothetical protein